MDINGLILLFVVVPISILFGVTVGKAIARDDAIRLGRFKFAGKTYKVDEGE
jgi:ABC-type sulfate transport system permease subunit